MKAMDNEKQLWNEIVQVCGYKTELLSNKIASASCCYRRELCAQLQLLLIFFHKNVRITTIGHRLN